MGSNGLSVFGSSCCNKVLDFVGALKSVSCLEMIRGGKTNAWLIPIRDTAVKRA